MLAACGSDNSNSTSGATTGAATTGAATTAATAGGRRRCHHPAHGLVDRGAGRGRLPDGDRLRSRKTAAIARCRQAVPGQHREHSAQFQAATKAAGGEPFTMPNPAVLSAIKPMVDALKDEQGVVALAFELETAAAQSYQSYVGTFTDPKLNPAIMAVGGVEARHAAVLAQVLNALGDPSTMPVPKAFQVTDKAVMAGTGVG